MDRSPLVPRSVRKIAGSFAFIEHRLLRDGFLESLTYHELALYFFLILAADRNGISFYGYDRICTTLDLLLDDYILARNALIEKDLIAFDGHRFQVLSLTQKPVRTLRQLLRTRNDMAHHDPATIHRDLCDAFATDPDEELKAFRK